MSRKKKSSYDGPWNFWICYLEGNFAFLKCFDKLTLLSCQKTSSENTQLLVQIQEAITLSYFQLNLTLKKY